MGMRIGKPNDLVKDCLAALRLWRILAWRMNTGAACMEGRWVRFGVKGCPDILGIVPERRRRDGTAHTGVFLGVEAKTGSGRPSAHQKAFRDNIRAAGGISLVVHDVKELEMLLRQEGAI